MSDNEISKRFGKYKDWLYMTKHINPDKYNKMMSFSDNKLASIYTYRNWIEELKDELATIYHSMDKAEWIKVVRLSGIYKCTASAFAFEKSVFSCADTLDLQWGTIVKFEKLLKYIKDEQ